jgi:hypothetical protein
VPDYSESGWSNVTVWAAASLQNVVVFFPADAAQEKAMLPLVF